MLLLGVLSFVFCFVLLSSFLRLALGVVLSFLSPFLLFFAFLFFLEHSAFLLFRAEEKVSVFVVFFFSSSLLFFPSSFCPFFFLLLSSFLLLLVCA